MGQTGETHQGILDLSFFKVIPNITIMSPKDFKELEDMMEFAVELNSPVVIRYPRGGEDKKTFEKHSNIQNQKSEIITNGKDVTIIAIGNQVAKAVNVCEKLKNVNIEAEVINARFLKPFDKKTLVESVKKTKFVITIEDNSLIGGLGAEVKEIIVQEQIQNITIKSFGYPDVFVEHGTVQELEKQYEMDEEAIFEYIKKRTNSF